MDLTKDIPAGTVISVVLRYIDHPAANPPAATLTVNSKILDYFTAVTTAYKTECNTNILFTAANVFGGGTFSPATPDVIQLTKIWGYPLHPGMKTSLYFNFEVMTFLPKATQIRFFLPAEFTTLLDAAAPLCYLVGLNKHITNCVTNPADPSIVFSLVDDFLIGRPLTLQYIGYASFDLPPLYHPVSANTLTGFRIEATYGVTSTLVARSPLPPTISLRVFPAIGTPSLTSPGDALASARHPDRPHQRGRDRPVQLHHRLALDERNPRVRPPLISQDRQALDSLPGGVRPETRQRRAHCVLQRDPRSSLHRR
jgi:hypothetical protein